MTSPGRVFGIVPAAGRSRRMGEPKLLMRWDEGTIVDTVLSAWCRSQTQRVVVVLRESDTLLRAQCERWPIELLQPAEDPVDMKASIRHALRYIEQAFCPNEGDAWMVAPADLPHLTSSLIDTVIAAAHEDVSVVAPRFAGRQGHPVLLRWPLAAEFHRLPADAGLNRLLHACPVHYVDLPAEARLEDVDTPTDYARLKRKGRGPS